ncbi:hypothetical protein [Streptomyces fagopyri]|uniref:hypothetical protein n=1 Tax=Streptomyces fagopyri TaxID=2662397 RepID=UPI001885A8A6|nr:hypothetical protein [Streptomyces fagopyri]
MRNDQASSTATDLPDPHWTLTQTDWAGLNHAYGPATDAPKMLGALLDIDQTVRTKALAYVHGILHHQNTIYEATVPTALYLAAILTDPRTTLPVDKTHRDAPGCMRAELLAWIGSVADEVTNEIDAASRLHGFPLDSYPPAAAIRQTRPQLLAAVFAYVHDADRHVSEAAIAACIPLLDDAELLPHRATLVPLLREVLGTSKRWQHRERAIDALDAWGEDSSGLEGQRNPFLFCDSDLTADSFPLPTGPSLGESYGERPPF